MDPRPALTVTYVSFNSLTTLVVLMTDELKVTSLFRSNRLEDSMHLQLVDSVLVCSLAVPGSGSGEAATGVGAVAAFSKVPSSQSF